MWISCQSEPSSCAWTLMTNLSSRSCTHYLLHKNPHITYLAMHDIFLTPTESPPSLGPYSELMFCHSVFGPLLGLVTVVIFLTTVVSFRLLAPNFSSSSHQQPSHNMCPGKTKGRLSLGWCRLRRSNNDSPLVWCFTWEAED